MIRSVLVGIVLLASVMLCFAAPATSPAGSTTFSSDTHKVKLDYPATWKQGPLAQGTILVLYPHNLPQPGSVTDLFSLQIQNSGAKDDQLESVVEALKKGLAQRMNGQLVRDEKITVDSSPARRIVMSIKPGPSSLQLMHTITIHQGRVFTFQYVAAPDVFATMESSVNSVVDSVKWTEK